MSSVSEPPVADAPVSAGLVPAAEPERTPLDAAGIVAWLVMLALTVAFLAAVGASVFL